MDMVINYLFIYKEEAINIALDVVMIVQLESLGDWIWCTKETISTSHTCNLPMAFIVQYVLDEYMADR